MRIEARHDLSEDGFAIEERLYEFNRAAIGVHDGDGLGFIMRDDVGLVVGAALGYT
jgi:hypothetical protein